MSWFLIPQVSGTGLEFRRPKILFPSVDTCKVFNLKHSNAVKRLGTRRISHRGNGCVKRGSIRSCRQETINK